MFGYQVFEDGNLPDLDKRFIVWNGAQTFVDCTIQSGLISTEGEFLCSVSTAIQLYLHWRYENE